MKTHSLISTQTFLRALTASVTHPEPRVPAPSSKEEGCRKPVLGVGVDGQIRGDKECHFRDVTSYGRVWIKVAGKRGSQCGRQTEPPSQTPNSGLRHTSFRREVPESGVRSVPPSLPPSSTSPLPPHHPVRPPPSRPQRR